MPAVAYYRCYNFYNLFGYNLKVSLRRHVSHCWHINIMCMPLMIYFPKKFHMPSSTSFVLITTKPQCKENIRTISIFLLYIYNDITIKVSQSSKVYKYALVQDPKVGTATVASFPLTISHVCHLVFTGCGK